MQNAPSMRQSGGEFFLIGRADVDGLKRTFLTLLTKKSSMGHALLEVSHSLSVLNIYNMAINFSNQWPVFVYK